MQPLTPFLTQPIYFTVSVAPPPPPGAFQILTACSHRAEGAVRDGRNVSEDSGAVCVHQGLKVPPGVCPAHKVGIRGQEALLPRS